jgi:hypothetical protein
MTGRIVVIGARRSNLPDLWDDPRLLVLSSDEVARRGLPAQTAALVFTKFLRHSSYYSAIEEAKKRGIRIIPGPIGTGQLKSTLTQLLLEMPPRALLPPPFDPFPDPIPSMTPAPIKPDPPAPPGPIKRGDTIAWIRAYMQQRPDAKRIDILNAAKAAGFNASSSQAAYYAIKNQRPARGAKTRRSAPSAAPSNDHSLVTLIDEAMAALQLVREAAIAHERTTKKLQRVVDAIKSYND